MKKNVAPRKFAALSVRVLTETSHTQPGDVLRVTKNDIGYIAYNTRSGQHAYLPAAILRDPKTVEFLTILY